MSRIRFENIHSLTVSGARAKNKGIADEDVVQSIFSILKYNVLCSIATVTAGNRAYINTAYFCYSDELALYFLSHPSSLHCKNVLRNASVAMTIFCLFRTGLILAKGFNSSERVVRQVRK